MRSAMKLAAKLLVLGVVWSTLSAVLTVPAHSGPLPRVDPFGRPLPSQEQARQQLEQVFGQPIPANPPVRGTSAFRPAQPFAGPSVTVAYTLAESGTIVAATAADLAETPDVRFTPEVLEAVQRFAGDPAQLYLYVKNNFEFTPYVGSHKGSQGALIEFSGNDFDLASLLIALLRAAGIPARYVVGSMYIPIDQALNWLGVENPTVALQVLQWQGVPAQLVNAGGGSLLVDRVWVEAFVERHGPNPRWVPMDPAFKQYTVLPGSLIARQVAFDQNQYLALPVEDGRTAYEFFRDRVQEQLDATQPGSTIEDIERGRVIIPTSFTKGLPGRLENRERVAGDLSTLRDDQRYLVTLYTVDAMGVSAQATLRLPEVYGRRLTVSFPPATAADEALVQQYGGYYQVPADLLQVRPAIKLDGQVLAQGSRVVGIGQSHYLVVDFLFPGVGLVDRVFHTTFAGSYYAVGLDTFGDAHFTLRDRGKQFIAAGGGYEDGGIGEWLSLAALQYLNNVEQQAVRLAAVLENVQVKEVAEALTGQNIRLEYDVNGVLRFRPIGWFVDAKRVVGRLFAVDGDESDLEKKFRIQGLTGSYLENRLWEDFAATPAISTVIGFQFANQVGIPILTIDQSNVATLLPTLNVFPEIRQAVQDAVSQGHAVTIPRDTLFFHKWVGSVWIDDLPGGLATGYLIFGGLLGGNVADEPFKGTEPDCTELGSHLGADKYKAVTSTEGLGGKWRQFDSEGRPLQAGDDFGIMQINKSWAGKTIAGIPGPIDFERVQKEWDYNVDVGKAIFDDATRQANDFFTRLGITPTNEELAKESYFRYNHSPGFWTYKVVNGQKKQDRFVEFHYWQKDPITGQLLKKDYSGDSDFNEDQRKGATQSQKGADRYWFNLDERVWDNTEFPSPC